ncbi:MAG: hypothetical protein A2V88_14340 [Elusimicrobia bacterium RBG_16_66_12]|nr:MAG: hypothetical protein A2V88_14340 [Elusimicrobia bacterium RBG_16_66_12]
MGYAYFRVPRSGYVTRDGADAFSRWRISHPEFFAPVSSPHPSMPPRLTGPELSDPPPWSRDMADPATRARTMITVHASSLRRLVWPHPLQSDYAPKMALSWADPRLIWSALLWAGLLAAAVRLRRRRPLLAASLAWIPAAMVPVSGVVMMTNLTADRYLYTASAGVCLAVASLFHEGSPGPRGGRRQRGGMLFVLELAAVWAVLSASHLRAFRNDWLFFAATARADPDVPRARLNLAVVQSGFGRVQEAERNFKEAVRLWPRSRRAARAYADFLESQGRAEEARRLRESAERESARDNYIIR